MEIPTTAVPKSAGLPVADDEEEEEDDEEDEEDEELDDSDLLAFLKIGKSF